MKEIDVCFHDIKYPVYITNNFDSLSMYVDEHKTDEKVLIVTDSKVGEYYADEISRRLKNRKVFVHTMKDGEQGKSLETVSAIYDECYKNNFIRTSSIIALGGGVVGDSAGYAASTYMRGLRLIHIPTTLIADVDSSVGGKVGVNYKNVKNLVGNFYHPEFIYINTSVLKTLDMRHFISGMGEVIKYSILFDHNFFNYLGENITGILNLESDKLKFIIKKCISMKLEAVSNDIRDNGERQILNFGHTLGHVVETLCDFSILHGEAVALGMMFECALSYICGMLPECSMLEIYRMIDKYGLIKHFDFGRKNEIFDIIKHDKKIDRGNVKFILIKDIGNGLVVPGIKEDMILEALKFLEGYMDRCRKV